MNAKELARTQDVMSDVVGERIRQEAKWGRQNHDPFVYLAILGEEVGECCKAAVEAKFTTADHAKRILLDDLRQELIQTAAVAVAFVECLDRGEWDEAALDPRKGLTP